MIKKFSRFSASSLKMYEGCNKKFYYKYINKPKIVEKDRTHLEKGLCAHRALELFHEHAINNIVKPDEYNFLMSKFYKQAVMESNFDLIRADFDEIKSWISCYLKKLKKDGLPNVVSNEAKFTFKVGEVTVSGFIDRIDKIAPGHYKIVDYKTNKNIKYLEPFQLELYAYYLMHDKNKFPDAERVDGSYVLLRHESSELSYSDLYTNFSSLEKYVLENSQKVNDSIAKDVWEKNPTKLCNWCDFQHLCFNNWSFDEK